MNSTTTKGSTTMQAQQSCSERLPHHMDGRLQDFRDFVTLFDEGYEETQDAKDAAERLDIEVEDSNLYEAALERVYEYPLALETLRVHKIELSTGGPADWLEAFASQDGEITRIVYHFADWFDHAEKTLEGAEFDAAERFITALIPEF